MYQMKSTYISIIIIMKMYRKRQNYILRNISCFFLILTFSALWADLRFVKNIQTLIIFHPVFNEKKRNSINNDSKIVISVTIVRFFKPWAKACKIFGARGHP